MRPLDPLRLGTRGSPLALAQTKMIASRITETGGPLCQTVIIKTSGDRLAEARLSEAGGKGLFVKELEEALLRGDVDAAVHSSKDLPAALAGGLVIGAVLPREDPRDALVLPAAAAPVGSPLEALTALGSAAAVGRPRIGTSSLRRVAQLSRLLPHAQFRPIRGNLDTRLRKLDQGEYDALVLAAAGLRRLGLGSRISMMIPVEACVPAPGQGAIAVEIRAGDDVVRGTMVAVDDPAAGAALAAERALVAALGGGCDTPVGALAVAVGGGTLELTGVVVAADGTRAVRVSRRGPASTAALLGSRVAADLLAGGAREILGGL